MSSNETENTQQQDQSNNELLRIDNFVKMAPGKEYTIDQKEQELCRDGLNGQRECVKLNLECKYNESERERDCIWTCYIEQFAILVQIPKCSLKCKSWAFSVHYLWIPQKLIWNVIESSQLIETLVFS